MDLSIHHVKSLRIATTEHTSFKTVLLVIEHEKGYEEITLFSSRDEDGQKMDIQFFLGDAP